MNEYERSNFSPNSKFIQTCGHCGCIFRVERELIGDLKRVAGKNTLLCQLAETALAHPDGIIREVRFPVVDEQTLVDLVKEFKATGPAYRQ